MQGELASILTQFDRDIDEASVHKGKQMWALLMWNKQHKFTHYLKYCKYILNKTLNSINHGLFIFFEKFQDKE